MRKSNKRFVWLSLLCAAMGLLVLPARTFAQCGVERWSVKTGTDPDAGLVNLASASPTTFNNLLALARPTLIPDNQRLAPTETTLWTMSVTLNGYFLAQDSDYHMVLTDGTGRTMIAEIPSPTCVGPGSPFATGIAHARAQMNARLPPAPPGILQTLNVPVQLTGVGFFDFIGGQTGQAPNGIELHPVIDIVFDSSFSLSASPSPLNVSQGSVANTTISLSGNLSAIVALSASGLPPGTTASFNPPSITSPGPASSTLSVSVGPSTPIGTYNVLVTGTGGGQTHSTTINLTVNSAGTTEQLLGNPGFENGSANPAPWTVSAGVIDNSGFRAPHTGAWKAWLDGYGSAHTDTILQSVSIPSSSTSASLSFWLHIDTAETAGTASDTLKVQIRNPSGTVLATLATYSNRDANTGYRQVSFDLSSYKGQSIQIYLVGVENSKLKTSFVVDDFALNATGSGGGGDFAISSAPSALAIVQGGSGASTITTTISGSFNSAIALSASGLPAGATASFAPSSIAAPGSGSASLTILAGTATATGNYNVTVSGSSGSTTHSTVISVSVSGSGGATQQLLGNPGFESGSNAAPWTVSSGVIDNSAFEAAHAGLWKAWLNGYGSIHTDTLLQTVTVPSTATSASLIFWLHIDTAETTTTRAYDTLQVQVRNSAGTVLATLATYSNLNAATGYQQVSFDLSSYRGQTIQIYLIGVEDSSLKTSFVVDDFALNAVMP